MDGIEGAFLPASISRYLPLLQIQHDWQRALREGENVWISCSIPGKSSIHGHVISRSLHQTHSLLEATDDFEASLLHQTAIQVSSKSQKVSSIFQAPSSTFQNIHTKAVRCIDISSGAALGISCSDDGTLKIWNTADGIVRRVLDGHMSDVTHCRFFPSGIVALSGGIDMQLRIWSAENSTCARVLTGHKGAITDTAIIDRGKNIISCSRDGTAKLWNCGRGECDSTLISCDSVINGCCLHSKDTMLAKDNGSSNDSNLSGKILAVAREDCMLSVVEVQNTTQLFQVKCSSAVNCCEFLREDEIFCGCQNGELAQYDLRNGSRPLSAIRIGNSPILHITKFSDHICISRGDGSVQLIDASKQLQTVQLSGPDADAIYRLACQGNNIYSASRDGSIRKYSMNMVDLSSLR